MSFFGISFFFCLFHITTCDEDAAETFSSCSRVESTSMARFRINPKVNSVIVTVMTRLCCGINPYGMSDCELYLGSFSISRLAPKKI